MRMGSGFGSWIDSVQLVMIVTIHFHFFIVFSMSFKFNTIWEHEFRISTERFTLDLFVLSARWIDVKPSTTKEIMYRGEEKSGRFRFHLNVRFNWQSQAKCSGRILSLSLSLSLSLYFFAIVLNGCELSRRSPKKKVACVFQVHKYETRFSTCHSSQRWSGRVTYPVLKSFSFSQIQIEDKF